MSSNLHFRKITVKDGLGMGCRRTPGISLENSCDRLAEKFQGPGRG